MPCVLGATCYPCLATKVCDPWRCNPFVTIMVQVLPVDTQFVGNHSKVDFQLVKGFTTSE